MKRHALAWIAGGFIVYVSVACDPLVAVAQTAQDASHAQPIDWQTSPLDLDLRGMNGERYAFHCPPGKPAQSRVTGSGPYTDDSSICTAAVHAGRLHGKNGGDVVIEIRPGQASYAGSEENFVRSANSDRAWSGSFVVLRNEDYSNP
ncbi:MAG: LCCL domain-containing protein [Dokdonella sp.]